MESQPFTIPLRDTNTFPALAHEFAKFLGCDIKDKACLMAQNSTFIVDAQMYARSQIASDPKLLNAFLCWTPIVEGVVIPQQPFTALLLGNYETNIPVMLGHTAQEAYLFIYVAMKNPVSWLGYDAMLLAILGVKGAVEAALFEYPVPWGTNDTRPLLSRVATDYIFVCSNRNVTRTMTTYGPNVWLYDFNHIASFNRTAWYPNTQCYTAVCHGADLPFVFDSGHGYVNYTVDEVHLAASMATYWTNMAHTGNPNTIGPWNTYPDLQGLVWPAYTTSSSPSIALQTPTNAIVPFLQKSYCDFWDTLGYGY